MGIAYPVSLRQERFWGSSQAFFSSSDTEFVSLSASIGQRNLFPALSFSHTNGWELIKNPPFTKFSGRWEARPNRPLGPICSPMKLYQTAAFMAIFKIPPSFLLIKQQANANENRDNAVYFLSGACIHSPPSQGPCRKLFCVFAPKIHDSLHFIWVALMK